MESQDSHKHKQELGTDVFVQPPTLPVTRLESASSSRSITEHSQQPPEEDHKRTGDTQKYHVNQSVVRGENKHLHPECPRCGQTSSYCYATVPFYLRSKWLYMRTTLIFVIIYIVSFIVTYLIKVKSDQVEFFSYDVLGQVLVATATGGFVPFIFVPFVMRRQSRATTHLIPIHESSMRASWVSRAIPTILNPQKWYTMLVLVGYTFVLFSLPLLLILGLVLQGNTKSLDKLLWALIYAFFVAASHSLSFIMAFLWAANHRFHPVCKKNEIKSMAESKKLEKSLRKQSGTQIVDGKYEASSGIGVGTSAGSNAQLSGAVEAGTATNTALVTPVSSTRLTVTEETEPISV